MGLEDRAAGGMQLISRLAHPHDYALNPRGGGGDTIATGTREAAGTGYAIEGVSLRHR